MSTEFNHDLTGTQVWPSMFFTRRWSLHSTVGPKLLAFLKGLRKAQTATIESGTAVGAKSAEGLYESNFDLFKQQEESLQKHLPLKESQIQQDGISTQ